MDASKEMDTRPLTKRAFPCQLILLRNVIFYYPFVLILSTISRRGDSCPSALTIMDPISIMQPVTSRLEKQLTKIEEIEDRQILLLNQLIERMENVSDCLKILLNDELLDDETS